MTRAGRTALVATALCLFLASWSLVHHGSLGQGQISDTGVYVRYGRAIVDGQVPYRDFKLEYPPAALAAFVVPALFAGERPAYDRWFDREMAFCGCLALVGAALCLHRLGAGAPRSAAALALFGVSPVLIGSVVLTRFDLWPAALAVLALAALLWERRTTAAVLLAAGIGAKLWPAVLIPVACFWLARTYGPRAAAAFAAVVAFVVAAIFVPFAVLGPHGLGHSFHSQLSRPLQIESLGAAAALAVHRVAHQRLYLTSNWGSQNLAGPGVHAIEIATSVVQVAGLVAVWAFFARGAATSARLALGGAASIAMFLAFGKVFSPQFVLWLVPFVILVPGRLGVAAGTLAALAFALTHTWFPRHYWSYAAFHTEQIVEVLARDLVVVALALLLTWRLRASQTVRPTRARAGARPRVPSPSSAESS